jgi:replication factor A1
MEDLNPGLKEVNMEVKVVSKNSVKYVGSKLRLDSHRVCEVLVGDETEVVYLALWDNAIEKVHENDALRIENGYIKLFRGSMRLNIGKYGKLSVLEGFTIQDVNTENNVSTMKYPQERHFSNDFRW